MKIRPVGAELFHANRRTDMTKLIVTFRNFANAPKNWTEVNVKYPVRTAQKTLLLIKTSQLMLYREIIAVCSQIHSEHINTVVGKT